MGTRLSPWRFRSGLVTSSHAEFPPALSSIQDRLLAPGLPSMNLHDPKLWEITAAAIALASAAAISAWLIFRKRPTPDEIELARRLFLTQSGRIVDGTLLDLTEVPGPTGGILSMLLYEYRIGGVDYECSQDITLLGDVVSPAHISVGFPCSVRYQPGSPQNSIVVAERWSGIRASIPVLPAYDDPEPIDISHLNPGS